MPSPLTHEKPPPPFTAPLEWRQFFREGDQFLHLAAKGLDRPEKFSAETLYNLTAMAMEKHLMALFLANNSLPEGHTLTGLLAHGEKFLPIDREMLVTLAAMDAIQEICSLDAGQRREPTVAELAGMIGVAGRIRDRVMIALPKETNRRDSE